MYARSSALTLAAENRLLPPARTQLLRLLAFEPFLFVLWGALAFILDDAGRSRRNAGFARHATRFGARVQ